ncbi:AAA family ATPase [Streptomyces sp. NBC_00237]|uniref:ATP-binding protein n=1 Tax=Streptomyces sp. NBC_00237 TaxID=2975687 RepID=UPI00225B9583|nr:AAA family ATPase [Streptomyces sp. NBC_00237]MCX5202972.1 AAA family ATPase [Streptomyces sp. NBC_00237]
MPVPRPENPAHVPQLIERDAELAAAAKALDALCGDPSPRGGVLLFRGEAGIGKTALLGEIQLLARDRGCVVWSARGGETVASVAFHVVRHLLQPALAGASDATTRGLLGDWHTSIAPALGITPPNSEVNADPQGVRDGLDTLVGQLAALHRPLVLVVDDLQWSDLETLRWLVPFAGRTGGPPLLLVTAYRVNEAKGETAALLRQLDTTVRRVGIDVVLGPLSPPGTARFAREVLGEHADDPFCREVWAVTGGNLYETVELVARAKEQAIDPVEGTAGSLRPLMDSARPQGLVERLQKMGDNTVNFAFAVAILETDVSLKLAADLAVLGVAEAAECAERLRAARILTGEDEHLEFVHPTVATAVYDAVPHWARRAMHGIAAEILLDDGHSAAAASRHLMEVPPEENPELVEQLRAAHREYVAVGAPDAARLCLERALKEPPLPTVFAQVRYELGKVITLSAPATAAEHLTKALEQPGLDDEQQADAVFLLSQALTHNNQAAEAGQMVAAAAEAAPEGPLRMRLQTVQFLWEGVYASEIDGPARSRRLKEAAAHVQGCDTTEQALLMLRAFDATAIGEDAQAVVEIGDRALVNGSLPAGLTWTDLTWGFEPPALLGLSYAFADQLDRADALFGEARRAFTEAGWSGGHLAFAYALTGYLQRRRGNLVRAEVDLRESVRLAERVGKGLPMHWDAVCMLIDTLLARGLVADAQQVADGFGFHAPYPTTILIPDAASVRGRLLLAQGRTADAIDELEAAGAALKARGRHNTVLAPWALDLARAVAPDDPERAGRLAAYAREKAERFGTNTAIGEAMRCQAELAEGQRKAELLRRAVDFLSSSPCKYEHAAARIELGRAIRSRAELEKGRAHAVDAGAAALVKAADETLRELGFPYGDE